MSIIFKQTHVFIEQPNPESVDSEPCDVRFAGGVEGPVKLRQIQTTAGCIGFIGAIIVQLPAPSAAVASLRALVLKEAFPSPSQESLQDLQITLERRAKSALKIHKAAKLL